jgi:hypothetical protein
MKSFNYLLLGFLICASNANAQIDPVGAFNRHVFERWSGEYIRVSQYKVKGSPFFLGESFPGTIVFKNGKVSSGQSILYNLYEQKAGIDRANQLFELSDTIAQFTIILPEKFGGQQMNFKNGATLFGEKGFLHVLVEGAKLSLFKKYNIRLTADPSNSMDKDAKVFDQYYEYHLYNHATGQFRKVKLKEKEITKEVANDAWVKAYAAQHKGEPFDELYVVKLIQEFNEGK